MKTKIFSVLIFFSFLFLPLTGKAAETIFQLTDILSDRYYRSDFDRLVLDFTIMPAESIDSLKALTVVNIGDAKNLRPLTKIILWQDAGTQGFQGHGLDQRLGTMIWSDYDYWYLDNLDTEITQTGSRFFVSIETASYLSQEYTTRFGLSDYYDQNGDGIFDLIGGDRGVYLASKNNGPIGGLINGDRQRIITSGYPAPVSRVTSLTDGQTVGNFPFTIKGWGRARGPATLTKVLLQIVKSGKTTNDWQEPLLARDADGYYNFEYSWNPAEDGEYIIKTKSINSLAIEEEEQSLSVAVQHPIVLPFNNKDLVQATGQEAIYWILNGQKRVFPHLNVYLSWGLPGDFSSVEKVSAAQLALYDEGEPVPFRDGSLFRGTMSSLHAKAAEAVFFVSGAKLYDIKSAAVYQTLFSDPEWKRVTWVPDDLLAKFNYPYGGLIDSSAVHPNGSIIRYAGSSKIYLISSGQKRAFIGSAFSENRYLDSSVIDVFLTETYPDSALITGKEDSLIYPS